MKHAFTLTVSFPLEGQPVSVHLHEEGEYTVQEAEAVAAAVGGAIAQAVQAALPTLAPLLREAMGLGTHQDEKPPEGPADGGGGAA